jgi:hypothetical protein
LKVAVAALFGGLVQEPRITASTGYNKLLVIRTRSLQDTRQTLLCQKYVVRTDSHYSRGAGESPMVVPRMKITADERGKAAPCLLLVS